MSAINQSYTPLPFLQSLLIFPKPPRSKPLRYSNTSQEKTITSTVAAHRINVKAETSVCKAYLLSRKALPLHFPMAIGNVPPPQQSEFFYFRDLAS